MEWNLGLVGSSSTYRMIWDTIGFIAFRVMLGSFGTLTMFLKMQFKKKNHYFFYKSQPNPLKLLTNYLLSGPHKTAFGIFEILKFEMLTNIFLFVNIGPNSNDNFNALPLLKTAAKHFQTCPEFSSQWSSQNYVGDFSISEFPILNYFFRNFQFHHCPLWKNQILNYLINYLN